MQRLDIIAQEEGLRLKPYYCSEGYPTIGYGKKLGDKGVPLEYYDFEITEPMARLWLEEEVNKVVEQLEKNDVYNSVDEYTKAILVSMAYQIGIKGLMKFKRMWSNLAEGNFLMAGCEALDSRWAKQTPHRATRHANVISKGYLL